VERSSGAAPPRPSGGSGTAPLNVSIEDLRDGVAIVGLAGELDVGTIPRIDNALSEQLRQRQAVLVDLTELSFIDSSGIGMLMRAFRQSNGTPMHVILGPDSQVNRVFRLAGIDEAMPVFADRAGALAALPNEPAPDGDRPG
jgi:anti-anti-sigma factor